MTCNDYMLVNDAIMMPYVLSLSCVARNVHWLLGVISHRLLTENIYAIFRPYTGHTILARNAKSPTSSLALWALRKMRKHRSCLKTGPAGAYKLCHMWLKIL